MPPQAAGFNLFRVNCLLNDTKSANFNSIILSIIQEYFYENNNQQKKISDVYNYIRNYLKIVIEIDFLTQLIANSDDFDIQIVTGDSLLNLKSEKFSEIDNTISKHSVSAHITNFLEAKGLNLALRDSIENLLYAAVFENINSFSVDSFESLLPKNDDFTKEDVDLYNCFLDYQNEEKNRAIYNILSRAVEFAILTSGKGIKEISKELFNDKSFILDTNIIFRLLGVGGAERSGSISDLLTKCRSLGMRVQYTGKTHLELTNKLDQIINFLNTAKVLHNIDMLGEISETHPEMVDDDFIVHYSLLKRKGVVHTPEQYQRKLHRDYRTLLDNLQATIFTDERNIDPGDVAKLAKVYFSKKKELKIYYGRKASEVDAYNVLVVRRLRGGNNHNFSDVKSFYLTSDRSLNVIVSKENMARIPETILPSQLYILCKPYFDTDTENDYDEFIKFIKRRKTEFKYGGSQVLSYINSIRELTTEVEVISESLILYTDIKYRSTQGVDGLDSHSTIPNYKQVLKTILDKKLNRGEETEYVFQTLKVQTEEYATNKFKLSRNLVRAIDILLTILIIPFALYLSKLLTKNIAIQVASVLVCESLKFYLTSRFKFTNNLHFRLYRIFTGKKRSSVNAVHNDLVNIIDSNQEKTKENIWK